jgi:hypothetical protein
VDNDDANDRAILADLALSNHLRTTHQIALDTCHAVLVGAHRGAHACLWHPEHNEDHEHGEAVLHAMSLPPLPVPRT